VLEKTVHYGSGTDSGEDVYLNGGCRTDFGDVRFTDNGGVTELDYWIEEKTDSDYAIFWVEVKDDLSSSDVTIYIYYGKSDATTTSNGSETFIFFEDWDTIDSDIWKLDGNGSASTSDSILTLTGGTENEEIKTVSASYGTNTALRAKIWAPDPDHPWLGLGYVSAGKNLWGSGDEYRTSMYRYSSYPDGIAINGDDENVSYDTDLGWSTTDVVIAEIKRLTNKALYLINDVDDTLTTYNTSAQREIGLVAISNLSKLACDWILIRKCVDPEPSHGTWGTEECGNWLQGWLHRKFHVINAASGAGKNYPIKITVHYDSGTDNGEHVYLNGKCRKDFGDVRFTARDGITLLDYWIDKKSNSDYAIFWVEVKEDLSDLNRIIYIYYNKTDETTISNGFDTFLQFDDFDDGNLDGWTKNITPEASTEQSYSPNYSCKCNYSDESIKKDSLGLSLNYALKFRFYLPSTENMKLSWIMIKDSNNEEGLWIELYGGKIYWNNGSWIEIGDYSLEWNEFEALYNPSTKKYHIFINGVDKGEEYGPQGATGHLNCDELYFSSQSSQPIYFDDIVLRKFVDPEPSNGDWGEEETGLFQIVETHQDFIFLELWN